MLAKRIIPCLDVHAGRVVKGVKFVQLRDAGDPVEIASTYDAAGADEIAFLDITASSDARNTMVEKALRTDRRFGLQLRKDGTYRLQPFEDREDFSVFLACLTTHTWKEKHDVS